VPDCVREPQAIHASRKVDVRKHNPDVLSGFKQKNCLVRTPSLKRVEPCFLQKGYCMHAQQELIFDNRTSERDMGITGLANQGHPEGEAIKANVASHCPFHCVVVPDSKEKAPRDEL
jgi:hypothetical protein